MKNCVIYINEECCICLEYLTTERVSCQRYLTVEHVSSQIHKLKCCGNEIHTKCIYEMFVYEPVIDYKVIFKCPLCRNTDNFSKVLSFKDLKKYTNDKVIIKKYIFSKFIKFDYNLFILRFLVVLCMLFIGYLLIFVIP